MFIFFIYINCYNVMEIKPDIIYKQGVCAQTLFSYINASDIHKTVYLGLNEI